MSSTFGHDKNTLPSQNLRPRPTGKQRHSSPASAPSHDIQRQWPPLSSNKKQAQSAHVGRSPGLPPSKVETSFERYALPLPTIIVALVIPYRGANHRDALAGLRSSSCDHQVCDVEPRTYPCMRTCAGWSNPPKKHQNPGTPRTRSLLSFTSDPGGLVQQHQAPVACFDEIKHGLLPLPNSSSHIREKLKRPTPILQTTGKESCRQARFGMLFSPLPTQWCGCCGAHSGRVDHKQLSDPESKRPQTASAALSCPEREFLVAACVPVKSRTAPRRHGMITHLPENVPEPYYPPVSHGSSVSEVDDRRTRGVPSSPQAGAPHCLSVKHCGIVCNRADSATHRNPASSPFRLPPPPDPKKGTLAVSLGTSSTSALFFLCCTIVAPCMRRTREKQQMWCDPVPHVWENTCLEKERLNRVA